MDKQTYEGWSRPDPGMRRDIVGVRDLPDPWISVKEQMPEYDVDVHLWAHGWKRVHLGYWRHSEEWIGRSRPECKDELPDTNPTHWMPLPAPPSSDGRTEYLMHNEALCRPYYIAVSAPKEEK